MVTARDSSTPSTSKLDCESQVPSLSFEHPLAMASLHLWLVKSQANLKPRICNFCWKELVNSHSQQEAQISVSATLILRHRAPHGAGGRDTSTLENCNSELRAQAMEPCPPRCHLAGVGAWVAHCPCASVSPHVKWVYHRIEGLKAFSQCQA